MTIVYQSEPGRGQRWQTLLAERDARRALRIWPDCGDRESVRYLVTWRPPADIMRQFPNLEVLFSIGAGVDQFDFASLPDTLPVVRMVEPGIVQCMIEYVTFAVLGLHRDMPAYLAQQRQGEWRAHPVRPAMHRRVGVMGVGQLGSAVLKQLKRLGFDCHGWNRSPRQLDGIPVRHGAAELAPFLARSEILVCLLPLTEATRGMLDAKLFAGLPRGAGLVQVGRGPQLVDRDLLAALDDGQVGAAVLDVVDPEPLGEGHPFWVHPRVWLTPHIASVTQPDSAFERLYDNILRFERGEPMIGVVDRRLGY